MATIEVSTWAELVSAISSAARGDTIQLIADIDCNNEIPEGVSSTIQPTNSSTRNITITGEYTDGGVTKRHEIKNLRTSTSSAVTIFKFIGVGGLSSTTTIKGIDFLNLILNASFIDISQDGINYTHILNIRNCRFTGKRTDYLVNLHSDSRLNIYNSYINIPYFGSTLAKRTLNYIYSAGSGYMNSCRIRETFTGTYTPSSADGDATCSVFNMRLSGCRVEGEVVGGKYARYHADTVISGYTPSAQNVYDVDFKLTNDTDTSVPLYAFKGVVKVPIRKKDAETTTYEISNASTGVILADESQMKDANWLIQQGFDIVPSNQGG
jgi:hypothetical protein